MNSVSRKHKWFIIGFILSSSLLGNAQTGITFKVETLSKPQQLLWVKTYDDILKQLILSDFNLSKYDIEHGKKDFNFDIVAKSQFTDSLVDFGYHPFFNGMYQAYADHRPFVLSPDMIWLLISQGFAQHVKNNSEDLRKYFVDFKGKQTLIVNDNRILLDNPDSPWEEVFPEFTKQIGTYTGNDLIDALTCDFTTTTTITKVASQITIMEAMKPYFEFIVMYIVCGIPEITLEGTPEDWQKVLTKANSLRKYKLDWWIDEINPLLIEFVKTANGEIDKEFWQNMFKYHSKKKYGAPKIIDGWIVKFFPYDKEGKRNNLNEIIGRDNLPNEIVKVDLEYIKVDGDKIEKTPLELWAGFVGLSQNQKTFSLKPEIGWMVKKKDINNTTLLNELKSQSDSKLTGLESGIQIRVKTVPKELLQLTEIKYLEIEFIDKIDIPDEMGKIKIGRFRIYGKINSEEIGRICRLFPQTELIINDKVYNLSQKQSMF
jgi:hypothetical protein